MDSKEALKILFEWAGCGVSDFSLELEKDFKEIEECKKIITDDLNKIEQNTE